MSDNPSVFLVTLDYTGLPGGGSMTAHLGVDPKHRKINGRADGKIQEGTESPLSFSATFEGSYHHSGLKDIVIVGGGTGQAMVSVQPPAIGTYLDHFAMGFAVDENWNGTGSFSVGDDTYECKVKSTSK